MPPLHKMAAFFTRPLISGDGTLTACYCAIAAVLLLLCLCTLPPIFHPTYRVYMPTSLSSGVHARLSRSISQSVAAKTSLAALVTGKRPNAVAALLPVRAAAMGASDSHFDDCTFCSQVGPALQSISGLALLLGGLLWMCRLTAPRQGQHTRAPTWALLGLGPAEDYDGAWVPAEPCTGPSEELSSARPIETQEALQSLAEGIRTSPWLAVDMERAGQRPCLVQVAIDQGQFAVDSLAGLDLEPMWNAFERHGTGVDGTPQPHEVIIHAADRDCTVLWKSYRYVPSRIFDTALAAQLLGESRLGLQALVAKDFDVLLDKTYQQADWSVRPLPQELVAYALTDVCFLRQLEQRLRRRLEESGRLQWHAQLCQRQTQRACDPNRKWHKETLKLCLPERFMPVVRALAKWKASYDRRWYGDDSYVALPLWDLRRMVLEACELGVVAVQAPSTPLPDNQWEYALKALETGLQEQAQKSPPPGHGDSVDPDLIRSRVQRETLEFEALFMDDPDPELLAPKAFAGLVRHRDRLAAELGLDAAVIANSSQLRFMAVMKREAWEDVLMPWQVELMQGGL